MESANVAWVLVSAALVLFMTPGLAFFYGGMDRDRNVLNMLVRHIRNDSRTSINPDQLIKYALVDGETMHFKLLKRIEGRLCIA